MIELIILIVILASVVGPILFWLFVFFVVKRYLRAYQKAAAEQQQILNQLLQAQGTASPELEQQFLAAAARAQSSMSQLNGIHRERAELMQADLMGMAAQAGIEPPSF